MSKITTTAAVLVLILSMLLCSCSFREETKNYPTEKEIETLYTELTAEEVTTEEPLTAHETTAEPETTAGATAPSIEDYPPADGADYSTNIKNGEATALLDRLFKNLKGQNAAVYYEDLTTGEFFAFNEENEYCFQSVTKAFYVDWMLNSLSKEELNGKLIMNDDARLFAYYGGVADNPNGTELEISYLIEESIRLSDVASYNLLYNAFGVDGFNEYSEANGSELRLTTAYQMGRFDFGTVVDAASLLRGMWNRRDGASAKTLELMQSCRFNGLISAGAWEYKVAHKYGYGGEDEGVNDAAIVYSESPYILVVMSYIPGTADSLSPFFANISRVACDVNKLLQEARA